LIHRETGLLLRHVTSEPEALPDSDLVSGMLTAIRDFVGDAVGGDPESDVDLDAIQYGAEAILGGRDGLALGLHHWVVPGGAQRLEPDARRADLGGLHWHGDGRANGHGDL
jgi:hypothetical protein